MALPNFDNIVNKVKDATKQTLDKTARSAKYAKLKLEARQLENRKANLLQAIGSKLTKMYNDNHKLDGEILLKNNISDINEIEIIEKKLKDIEREIETLQVDIEDIEVKDITSLVHQDDKNHK